MRSRHVYGLLRKNWYLSMTRFEKFIDITFWPMFEISMWALLAIYIGQAGLNLVSFFLGSVFLWMLFMRSSQDSGIYLLDDYQSKSLHNLFVAPITEGELFTANVLFTLLRTLISAVLLYLFTLFVLQFNLFSIEWTGLAILFVPLLIVGWAVGIAICGALYRWGEDILVIVYSFPWLVQPFSCVFYPLASLPSWMQPVARLNPLTAVFEGFRAVLAHKPIGPYMPMAYLGALALLLLAMWFFVASIRASRRSGRLARS